jgi:hypothetical protein
LQELQFLSTLFVRAQRSSSLRILKFNLQDTAVQNPLPNVFGPFTDLTAVEGPPVQLSLIQQSTWQDTV